jgi:hypothetical protein
MPHPVEWMICYNAVKRAHVVEKEWDNIKKCYGKRQKKA